MDHDSIRAAPSVPAHPLIMRQPVLHTLGMMTGLARRATALGIDVVSAYGLSETCPPPTIAQQLDIRCTTGRPTPLVEVRVVDENGDDVTRAPWLTMSCFKQPELGEIFWRGASLDTGDIPTMDEGGARRGSPGGRHRHDERRQDRQEGPAQPVLERSAAPSREVWGPVRAIQHLWRSSCLPRSATDRLLRARCG